MLRCVFLHLIMPRHENKAIGAGCRYRRERLRESVQAYPLKSPMCPFNRPCSPGGDKETGSTVSVISRCCVECLASAAVLCTNSKLVPCI